MYSIDTDVPLPTKPHRDNSRYPWNQMEVGHSFFVPSTDAKTQSLRNLAYMRQRRHPGERYSVISEENGTRVFRVE